jgi:hypothetical protein
MKFKISKLYKIVIVYHAKKSIVIDFMGFDLIKIAFALLFNHIYTLEFYRCPIYMEDCSLMNGQLVNKQ